MMNYAERGMRRWKRLSSHQSVSHKVKDMFGGTMERWSAIFHDEDEKIFYLLSFV